MTPNDKAAVEQSAGMVIDALAQNSGDYAQRTAKKAADWGKKMREWSAKHDGGAGAGATGHADGAGVPGERQDGGVSERVEGLITRTVRPE